MHTPMVSSAILLLIAVSTTLLAQPTGDVLVSPAVLVSSLPEDARIESAASVGTRRLIVWGSTVPEGENAPRNVLWMQVLDGSTPIGSQALLTDGRGEPSQAVRVIPLADAFAVVWYDRREDGPGLYIRRIGLDGAPLGPESRISKGKLNGSGENGIGIYGDPVRGYALFWTDTRSSPDRSGVYTIQLSSQGTIIGTELYLKASIYTVTVFPQLGGMGVVDLILVPTVVLRPDGGISSRTIPIGRLTGQYHLASDTSLVTLQGRTLTRYASLFDKSFADTVTITAIDSASSGLVHVTRDAAGVPTVIFGVVRVSGGTRPKPAEGARRITFYAVKWTSAGLTAPVPIYENIIPNTIAQAGRYYLYDFWRSESQAGCANTRRFTVQFLATEFSAGTPGPVSFAVDVIYEFSIDGSGVFKLDRASGTPRDEAVDGPSSYIGNCSGRPRQTVTRVAYDLVSSVSDTIGGVPVLLTAEIAQRPSALPSRPAGITSVGGRLLVSWSRDGVQELGEWGRTSTRATVLDTLSIGPLPPKNEAAEGNTFTVTAIQHTLDTHAVPPGSAGALLVNRGRVDYVKVLRSGSWVPEIWRQAKGELFVARGDGWKSAIDISSFTKENAGAEVMLGVIGYDPNRAETIVRTIHSPAVGDSVIAVGADGAVAWTMPDPHVAALDLPIGPGEVAAIVDNRLTRYTGLTPGPSVELPAGEPGSIHQRILGPWFIRMAYPEGSTSRFMLERFGIDGARAGSIVLTFPSVTRDPMLIQSPRDSSMILLYIRDGVRMTRIAPDLSRVLAQDVQLSVQRTGVSAPMGAVRNDTLFAIWEDARFGFPAVFGSYIPMSAAVAAAPAPAMMPGARATLERLYPNPATATAWVELSGPPAERGVVEIIDMMGRPLVEQRIDEGGGKAIGLPVGELESGAYLVRLRGEPGPGLRLTIVR